MPYLPMSELEKQRLQESAPSNQMVSGPSGVITSGGSSGPAPRGPTKSGSYTNLQSYLSANKEQAADMAGKVVGNIEAQGTQARSGVDNLVSNFQTRVNNAAVRPDAELLKQAASNPTEFVKDPGRVQQFTRMRDAQYTGPMNLVDDEGFGAAQKKAQDIQTRLKATETEAGRFGLVQEQFAKPTYSRGQQRLDQFLLQTSPDARQKFEIVRGQFSNLEDYLANAQQDSVRMAADARMQTERSRREAMDAIGTLDDASTDGDERTGALGELQGQLRARAADFQSNSERYRQDAIKDVQDDVVSDDLLASLGLQEGQSIYGVKLSDFLRSNSGAQVSEQSVATAEELARYKALSQLAGRDPSYISSTGSYRPYLVDRDGIQSALESGKKAYEDYVALRDPALQNAISVYRDLYSNYYRDPVRSQKYFGDLRDVDDLRSRIATFAQEQPWVWDSFMPTDSQQGRSRAAALAAAQETIKSYLNKTDSFGGSRRIRKN